MLVRIVRGESRLGEECDPLPSSGSGRLCPHIRIVGHSYVLSSIATLTILQTVIYLVTIYIYSACIKIIKSFSYSFEFIFSRSFSPASHSALLVLSIAGDRPAPPARLAWDHSPVFVVAWHLTSQHSVTSDIATQTDIWHLTSWHSGTMTSPWSQPRSPFRPASENEKMFQLTMDDVEANRTIIPSRSRYIQKIVYKINKNWMETINI